MDLIDDEGDDCELDVESDAEEPLEDASDDDGEGGGDCADEVGDDDPEAMALGLFSTRTMRSFSSINRVASWKLSSSKNRGSYGPLCPTENYEQVQL